jgi:hypothetical protein
MDFNCLYYDMKKYILYMLAIWASSREINIKKIHLTTVLTENRCRTFFNLKKNDIWQQFQRINHC